MYKLQRNLHRMLTKTEQHGFFTKSNIRFPENRKIYIYIYIYIYI